MATQMLEVVIGREASFQSEEHPIHRYLKILRHECHRETELINNLLDLSRLDAHTEPLCLSGMNLYHWLPHFCETFREPLQQQRLLLELDIPADLPLLTTDFSCLERILRELLQNACKYTPPRETVTIAVQSRPPFLQIQVCNSGVEIPPQECDRVFDKFYRIPNSDPWKYGGTGLGLALVKKLVEHLSGSISLASKNNQVTFTIVLPITLSVDDEAKT
jgi:signal transduction histidine kinase